MLTTSAAPLSDLYDLAMLDLDGVVYVGGDAVPSAPEHLDRARASGVRLAFVTNNASRPPATVAEHLRNLGIPAADEDVVTAAQAAARLLADELPPGAAVFVIGGAGLYDALAEVGLVGTQDAEPRPDAVVSGYHPDLRWSTVIAGAILVRSGLPWVASNLDLTVPTPAGPGPGNGVLVAAVAGFADRRPRVAGKPERPLFDETLRRVGGKRALVVGDRLDTDIAGARNAGLDSLLVMTGVTGLAELAGASTAQRPTYLAAGLSGLTAEHSAPTVDGQIVALGRWTGSVDDGALRIEGAGTVDDWWRVAAVTCWQHLDTAGTAPNLTDVHPPG